MGSKESCLHVESEKLHGKGSPGKRGQSEPWLSGELVREKGNAFG
jgi:hypothetical protein